MIEFICAVITTTFIIGIGKAKIFRFEKDRSYFPTILIVIALVYILFAVMSSNVDVIIAEAVVATMFITGALYGSVNSLRMVAILLIVHGLYDFIHPHIFNYNTVPSWWPIFCLYVDVILGVWIFFRYNDRKVNHL
ncbi:MAG: hypothetical protein RIB15_08550 [Gracilimonas sp.]|uniref:hypothetical protein n=1 Tax=Gracilimonas sp. TaxID=1974203 RepID=UPI0032EF6C22